MVTVNGTKDDEAPRVDAPASNYILPGSHLLPTVSLPDVQGGVSGEPDTVAQEWIDSFNRLLNLQDGSKSSDVFLEKSFWRDLLCLSWDFRTLHDRDQIQRFADDSIAAGRTISLSLDKSAEHRKPAFVPLDLDATVTCLQAFFDVETDVGRGKGIVRLVPDVSDGQKWKAFTLFTTLQELKGHEELIKGRRPAGVRDGQDHGPQNWKDKRDAEQNFGDGREPAVVILGRYFSMAEGHSRQLTLLA